MDLVTVKSKEAGSHAVHTLTAEMHGHEHADKPTHGAGGHADHSAHGGHGNDNHAVGSSLRTYHIRSLKR
jgi:hypothetical protein